MTPHSPIASRRWIVFGCLAFAVAAVAPARADDAATAQILFETAQQLMREGKYAEACPKLAESQRLDPGGGTLLNLAVCHEKEGKTATAWGEFKEALGVARSDGRRDRIELAEEHIAQLEPALSRLTVTVSPEARVAGLVVTVDGTEMGEPAWGIAMPVDPGSHVVAARAPGYEPWETTVTIGANADAQAVLVPALQASPTPSAPAASTPAAPSAAPPAAPSGPPPPDGADRVESDGSTQRMIGFVVGGAGLASAIVGGVFGGMAIANEGEAEEGCDDEVCTSETAFDASEVAGTQATLSNVFIGVGAGLVVAGLIAVLTAPDGPEEAAATTAAVTPWLAPGEAGVAASFAW